MEKSQEVSSMLETDPHAGLFTPPDAVPSTSKGQATVGNYQNMYFKRVLVAFQMNRTNIARSRISPSHRI
jgi:hypothetical protein